MKKIYFKLFLFYIYINNILSEKDCLSLNNKNDSEINLNSCTNKAISEETAKGEDIRCCLLTIDNPSKRKCIVMKFDEDEIEKRIDAFKIMFKNAEEINIDCSYHYLYINITFFILIFLYLI